MEVNMNSVCNYVVLDQVTRLYGGDDYEGNVYVAVVEEDDRFKHASWVKASESQRAQYWSIQRENRLASQDANYCPETGSSVFFCTCGWH